MRKTLGRARVALTGRPDRENVIDHDEVLSLRIDLMTMTSDQFFDKYFTPNVFIEDHHEVVQRVRPHA